LTKEAGEVQEITLHTRNQKTARGCAKAPLAGYLPSAHVKRLIAILLASLLANVQ